MGHFELGAALWLGTASAAFGQAKKSRTTTSWFSNEEEGAGGGGPRASATWIRYVRARLVRQENRSSGSVTPRLIVDASRHRRVKQTTSRASPLRLQHVAAVFGLLGRGLFSDLKSPDPAGAEAEGTFQVQIGAAPPSS